MTTKDFITAVVAVIAIMAAVWFGAGLFSTAEATVSSCPSGGSWTKVEPLSGHSYTWTAPEGCKIVETCYKHSTYTHYKTIAPSTKATVTADWHSWHWYDLSHASFKTTCTPTPTSTATPSSVPTPTATPTVSATPTPSSTPSVSPSLSPSPSSSEEPSPSPSQSEQPTPSDTPSETHSPSSGGGSGGSSSGGCPSPEIIGWASTCWCASAGHGDARCNPTPRPTIPHNPDPVGVIQTASQVPTGVNTLWIAFGIAVLATGGYYVFKLR